MNQDAEPVMTSDSASVTERGYPNNVTRPQHGWIVYKPKRGRPRKWKDNAERQRQYRYRHPGR